MLLQLAFERFAGDIAWEGGKDHHIADALELGTDAGIDPGDEFVGAHLHALSQDDGRYRRLSPPRMRRAKYGDFGDAWVLAGDLLDVSRVDVHAARNDHVLFAVGQIQETFLIDIAHVARTKPAVNLGAGRQVGPLVVTRHHQRATPTNLADLARCKLRAILSKDAHFVERD